MVILYQYIKMIFSINPLDEGTLFTIISELILYSIMLIFSTIELYLLIETFVLSINIIYSHMINKSKINIYKGKNIMEKLAIKKKKIIFAAKRKGGLLFLKGILLFTVCDQPS